MADPDFCKRGRIDVLIGASLFFDLMSVGQIRLDNNLPVLQKTRLGWVVSGRVSGLPKSFSLATSCKGVIGIENESLTNIVKSFWSVENNFDCASPLTSEDALCEDHFKLNTIRINSGQY